MKQFKTCLVTGATSGIGFAVCAALLEKGYRVIGLGRSEENCLSAENKLRAVNPAYEITYFYGDLMQQAEVLRLASIIRSDLEQNCGGALAALVNNAGCFRSWYMTTGEGYEQQFALNHLSGFLLSHELLPNIIKGGGRVLFTSSGSHKRMKINWSDIMFEKKYRPLYAYKQSKLCNMLTALRINEYYAAHGISAYGIDPGLVRTEIGNKDTGKIADFVWKRRSRHGVDPSVPAKIYAALIDSQLKEKEIYFDIGGSIRPSREVTAKNAERLFEISEKLCNIRFGVHECLL